MTTLVEARSDHAAVTVGQTVKDTFVLVKRNVLKNVRLPQLLVFATIQPVMFLLLFNYVFGGSIGLALPPAANGQYINWLLPGLLIQVATFGASQTAIGLTDDLKNGVIDRFRSLPMARSAVLAGRTIADLARNAFVIGLMLLVGTLIGYRPGTSWLGLLAGFGVALAFAFAFSWAMATMGLLVKDPETAQIAGFLPLFPLVFASSVFTPTDTMPAWLRAFADHQPITVVANAIRGLTLGREALADVTYGLGGATVTQDALASAPTVSSQVWLAMIWVAGILLVFAPLAVRMYRRAVD